MSQLPTHIPMIDLGRLHQPIARELEDAALRVIRSGQYINGPAVTEFENQLATELIVPNAIGVSSGTDALLCTLMALDVQPGDKIITTPYTFFATAGAIVRLGAIPVFIDICSDTYNIDTSQIESCIDEHTVGILPVHLFGCPANMADICDIAARHHLWVVEDAAQSLGGQWQNTNLGTIGTAGIFSFFPAKNLGALGDAGAIVTSDNRLADRIRKLRTHGAASKYQHELVGGNFRIDTLQAALLCVKLRYLREWNRQRTEAARRYDVLFSDIADVSIPSQIEGHAYNQYVISVRSDSRDKIGDALAEMQIASAVYYPVPLHLQNAFAFLGYGTGNFPVAKNAARNTLALPINPTITIDEQRVVAHTVAQSVNSKKPQGI